MPSASSGVVLDEGVDGCAACRMDPQQIAGFRAHVVEDEAGGSSGGLDEAWCSSSTAPAFASASMAMPFQAAMILVSVAGGIRVARCSSSVRAAACQRCFDIVQRQVEPAGDILGRLRGEQDGVALPVAADIDAPAAAGDLGVLLVQELVQLIASPDEVLAFDAFGVGVGGGVEGPVGSLQAVEQVVGRLPCDSREELGIAAVVGHPMRVQVQRDQEGVVVEHFLEVRDEPDLVNRVAMEASGELVVDAAFGHLAQRMSKMTSGFIAIARCPVQRLLDQELQVEGLGELGRAAEAAVRAVGGLQ